MSPTADRDFVENTGNSTTVGNRIPFLSYSSCSLVTILTELCRIPGFRDYRGIEMHIMGDVSPKVEKYSISHFGSFNTCRKPLVFFSLEIDFSREYVWLW
jgi:hypothetical protein